MLHASNICSSHSYNYDSIFGLHQVINYIYMYITLVGFKAYLANVLKILHEVC